MDALKEFLNGLKEQAEKAKLAKLSGTWWGWLVALVVGIVISLGVAWFLTKLRRRNNELTKARTDLEQQEAKLKNVEYQQRISVHQNEIQRLAEEAALLRRNIKNKRIQLTVQQRETAKLAEEALKVRDWATLDATNSAGR